MQFQEVRSSGLIRNNVQILGLSSFWDDIDDYAIMYRNVANGNEKVRYNNVLGSKQISVQGKDKMTNVSVLLNVKAGYILSGEGAICYLSDLCGSY